MQALQKWKKKCLYRVLKWNADKDSIEARGKVEINVDRSWEEGQRASTEDQQAKNSRLEICIHFI